MGVFEKKSVNLTKFEKYQVFVVQTYKIPYFPKPPNSKRLIENPLKQAKIVKFTKLLNFQCIHVVNIDKILYIKLQNFSFNILNNYPLLEQAIFVYLFNIGEFSINVRKC